ncbi:MAG: ATP-binding protein, partial [Gemmatimonadetes bacterium]|nr:ATP-binding protein [Gemmatimonadota bacterium]
MYLTELYLENTGPISKCHVKPPFADNGNPLPVVVVGPNGSGKSVFLSYIVDSLTEFAKEAFDDIAPRDSLDRPYFRIMHPMAIRSGLPFSLSLLHFRAHESDLYYREKVGNLDRKTYPHDLKHAFSQVWNWEKDKNEKDVSADKKVVETEMRVCVHAFFPMRRREEPDWLNPRSLKVELNPLSPRFTRQLDKPLWVETSAEKNIPWILDMFLDSLIDLGPSSRIQTIEGRTVIHINGSESEIVDIRNHFLLRQARQNIERILQAILQDATAQLRVNLRGTRPSRLSIELGNGKIIPALQSLSEGQSQLLHLFTTIIRYGEQGNLNRSIRLSDITGLVVIDEIDSHLHPTLQHDVLPELIQLFPKVQFVVSSHSPLFLLGMENKFDPDGLAILEMPTGRRINSEQFSEFGKAFEYYQATQYFEEEIEKRFAEGNKPLVLTEGPLDSCYIRTALAQLGYSEFLNSFDIEFVGIEDKKGTHYGGDDGLNHFRNIYESNPSLFHRPILLLYDFDTQKPSE